MNNELGKLIYKAKIQEQTQTQKLVIMGIYTIAISLYQILSNHCLFQETNVIFLNSIKKNSFPG